ncbi:MAG TPA: SDR family NAD(P)-dependent oxidoreductase, partial [Bacteroidales bacterium]|nr:SDR family NAD(P)-dependent oxidoreductase [Bacteroidales bacterium]
MNKWTVENIGDLNGKRIVITGSSHGIGFEAAGVLSSKGAEVFLAVRNREKGERAAAEIRAMNGSRSVAVMYLDLADLESVKRFAEGFIS